MACGAGSLTDQVCRLAVWPSFLSALLLVIAPSVAHHSASMFDSDRSITLSGTVTEFQWTNPHCFIQLAVPRGAAIEEWSIEMASPFTLFGRGWKRTSVKAGDQLTVVVHPMRDGGKGGALVSAKLRDGQLIGNSQ
jgi:hypothetical protein